MASESKSQRAARAKGGSASLRRGSSFSLDSEQSMRLLLFGVTGAVIIAAAAFIAFGYYYSVVKPRNRTVLEADGIKISYSAMKRRMMYEYLSNPQFRAQSDAYQTIPTGAYAALLQELTLISRAESELGITAEPAEVEKNLRTKLGVPEGADQQTFNDRLRAELDRTSLHDDEYRRLAKAEVLQEKIQAKFGAELPATVPQAKVEVIAVAEEATAQQAIDRVKAGEDWATVAKGLSLDPQAQTNGGLQDFAPEGTYPAAYNDYAFSATVGEISAPLATSGGFYVVRVVDRQDLPLTDEQKPAYENRLYNKWLADTQAKMTVVDKWTMDTDAQSAALQPIIEDLVRFLEQQQQQQQQPVPQVTVAAQPVPTAAAPSDSGSP